jgi:hypothetical protein
MPSGAPSRPDEGVVIGAIASYVIDLLTELLGEPPEREKRYAWALGDVSTKTGRAVQLPFDAVWESRRVIIEIDEDQHRNPVPIFDKPERMTVSGVARSEQRALYAERKRSAARAEGYLVLEIPWERRPRPQRRDRVADLALLRRLLEGANLL